MEGGNLHTFLHDPINQVDWGIRIKIASDIANGMAYLHRGGLIHRDLKSPNILLVVNSDEIEAKIVDFGLSGLSTIVTGRAVANPVWLAPEILRGDDTASGDQTKIDVYAFGVMMWELVTREDFFGEVRGFMAQLEDHVISGKRPAIPKDCPEDFAELIQDCWQNDPTARPSFSEIIEILNGIRNSASSNGLIPHRTRLIRHVTPKLTIISVETTTPTTTTTTTETTVMVSEETSIPNITP